jgi:hypothetical protein
VLNGASISATAGYLPITTKPIGKIVGVHEIDALSPGTSKTLPAFRGITVPSIVIEDIVDAAPFAM